MTPSASGALQRLAKALGGEAYGGGRRALIPAPGHGARDRSVSLLLVEGRIVVHSFGAADWRDVLDALRQAGWIDGGNRLCGDGGPAAVGCRLRDRTGAERIAAAQALWAAAGSLTPNSTGAVHCRLRRVEARLDAAGALRFHDAVPISIYRARGARLPALLARITGPEGGTTAVEVTYLDRRGGRSRLARPSRKAVGVIPPGSAVRFTDAAPEMLVAEGVFTTLSAMARFGLPGWALLSTSNLRRWRAPEGVRRVLIAADRGPDGEASAERLRRDLARGGVGVVVRLPPAPFGDWNDLQCSRSREEGRRGAPGPEGWSLAAGRELPHDRSRVRP